MYELTWLIGISVKQHDWNVYDLISLSWLFCFIYLWIYWFGSCCLAGFIFISLIYLLPGQVSFCFLDTTLILQISCCCKARQVAWSLGGWILRHLRGCFVLNLFKEPTFLVGTGSVSLLLSCDMIQRLYLFLSSLWYSQKQRQSCLLDRWLCREAQQCQRRIAVCCHQADVI